jgi:hypothetical protein
MELVTLHTLQHVIITRHWLIHIDCGVQIPVKANCFKFHFSDFNSLRNKPRYTKTKYGCQKIYIKDIIM